MAEKPKPEDIAGGQALIEGVMMRHGNKIAAAVRKPDKEIVIREQEHIPLTKRHKVLGLMFIRGTVTLFEMMFIGIETLNFSAEVAMHDSEAEESKKNGKPKKSKTTSKLSLILTVLFSLTVGIAIFFVGPLYLTTKLFNVEQQPFIFNITAGCIRIIILVGYMSAIAMMKDVKRLFQYHGAEHKLVYTFEQQAELNPDVAVQFTRFHPRCGTSFILIVMLVAILMFAVLDTFLIQWLGELSLVTRILTHLPLVPLVGGLSYEVIRWSAKRTETTIGKILVAPGLWLQHITTQEPDRSQLEVATVAVLCALGMEYEKPLTYIQQASELVTEQ